jgi:hypothetical protein
MAITRVAPAPPPAIAPARRYGNVVPALAVVGAGFLAVQAWVWLSWLADGPQSVRQYRDHDSVSWYLCRFYEALIVVVAVGMIAYLVRSCRRQGRLTFDAMLCLAGSATFWIDPIDNWFQPLFMYSSNWVNLRNWSGHVPFVVNPDAGRMPEPVLFIGLCYAFGFTLFLIVINAGMARAKRRWPHLSFTQLLVGTLVAGAVIDVVFELPMFMLRLWAFPGTPDVGIFRHGATKFPLVEIVVAGVVFGLLAALRFFRDDRGQTVIERGAAHLRPRIRGAATTLALVAVFNVAFLTAGAVQMAIGLYAAPYKEMPAHIVNGLCDAPGITGTRYGICPGTPGYRIPLRGDLEGPNP